MRIGIVGIGYVGLTSAACLAEHGNKVTCVDIDPQVVELLNSGNIHIHEDGLQKIVDRNVKNGDLKFTTDFKSAVTNSDVTFLCVGTPSAEDGSADLSYVYKAAEQVGDAIEASSNGKLHIVVDKSTVPVGTGDEVEKIIRKKTSKNFCVISNPEFLAEGRAVKDFMSPSRVIIGTDNDEAKEIMTRIYSPFLRVTGTQGRILYMGRKEAELTKYVANSMLATKVSFMNDVANLCDVLGANVSNIRLGIGSDPRIGNKFLYPSAGYGGSCFPKDVKAILNTAKKNNYDLQVIKAVHEVNEKQKEVVANKVINYFKDVKGKTFAIWGLAFKANTDDVRESAALVIIDKLLSAGAKIKVYDPKAMDKTKQVFGDKIEYGEKKYEILENSDALIVCTEWTQFRSPDFDEIKTLLNNPVIFDGRNLYELKQMEEHGIEYFGIGRGKGLN